MFTRLGLLPNGETSSSVGYRDGKAALCVSPGNLGNVLSQQLLKNLLLFSILKYSLRNHRELTRAVVEQ